MVKLNLPTVFLATSVALASGTLRGAVDESNRELQTNCVKSMDQYSLYAGKDAGTGRARPGIGGKDGCPQRRYFPGETGGFIPNDSPTEAPTTSPPEPPDEPGLPDPEVCRRTKDWDYAPGTDKFPVIPCLNHGTCIDFDPRKGFDGKDWGPCCIYDNCICGSIQQDFVPSRLHCGRFACIEDSDCLHGQCTNGQCNFSLYEPA